MISKEVEAVLSTGFCEVYTDSEGVHHYEFPEMVGDLGYSPENLRIVRLIWHAHPEWQGQDENSVPDWDAIDEEFVSYMEDTQ
ncbi:MAG: hypothetical protein KME06_09625 [Kastovskya adunca ATA6-11-RM4]|jgi:hypothetical protein|nr:hypothetical protein [Kastovskya adunca ATA6-11-RM4]